MHSIAPYSGHHAGGAVGYFHAAKAVRKPLSQAGFHRHGKHHNAAEKIGQFFKPRQVVSEVQCSLKTLVFVVWELLRVARLKKLEHLQVVKRFCFHCFLLGQ
jgi:hypothetical protein